MLGILCCSYCVPAMRKGSSLKCSNLLLGCPVAVTRSALNSHLRKCPASLVFCNKEWNRWPVYSPERKARVPFSERQYMARYGQLDVALALRDQRMLKRAMKAPKSVRSQFHMSTLYRSCFFVESECAQAASVMLRSF